MKFDPNAIPDTKPTTGLKVARLVKLTYGSSKSSGYDYWRLRWKLIGDYDAKTGSCAPYGYDVDDVDGIVSFSPGALTMTGKAFFAMRVTDAVDSEDEAAAKAIFEGRVALIDVKHEEYNGETRAKADAIRLAPPAILAAYPDRIAPGGGDGYTATRSNGSSASPSTFSDDDIPF